MSVLQKFAAFFSHFTDVYSYLEPKNAFYLVIYIFFSWNLIFFTKYLVLSITEKKIRKIGKSCY